MSVAVDFLPPPGHSLQNPWLGSAAGILGGWLKQDKRHGILIHLSSLTLERNHCVLSIGSDPAESSSTSTYRKWIVVVVVVPAAAVRNRERARLPLHRMRPQRPVQLRCDAAARAQFGRAETRPAEGRLLPVDQPPSRSPDPQGHREHPRSGIPPPRRQTCNPWFNISIRLFIYIICSYSHNIIHIVFILLYLIITTPIPPFHYYYLSLFILIDLLWLLFWCSRISRWGGCRIPVGGCLCWISAWRASTRRLPATSARPAQPPDSAAPSATPPSMLTKIRSLITPPPSTRATTRATTTTTRIETEGGRNRRRHFLGLLIHLSATRQRAVWVDRVDFIRLIDCVDLVAEGRRLI